MDLLQAGEDDFEQAEDNRGGDVGEHPQREEGEPGQRPAHEQIDEPEHVPLLAEDGLEARDIDPRHRDVRPQPEDRQHADREQKLPAEVRDPNNVGQPRNHASTSERPPAASTIHIGIFPAVIPFPML